MRLIFKGKFDAVPDETPANLATAIALARDAEADDRPTARALGAMLRCDEGGDGGEGPSTNAVG